MNHAWQSIRSPLVETRCLSPPLGPPPPLFLLSPTCPSSPSSHSPLKRILQPTPPINWPLSSPSFSSSNSEAHTSPNRSVWTTINKQMNWKTIQQQVFLWQQFSTFLVLRPHVSIFKVVATIDLKNVLYVFLLFLYKKRVFNIFLF